MDSRFWGMFDLSSRDRTTPFTSFTPHRRYHGPQVRVSIRSRLHVSTGRRRERERTYSRFHRATVSTFAFEIRMKSAGNNGQIRFNPNLAESLY
jgi:hypothetical protein